MGQIKSITPVKKSNNMMINPYGSNFENIAACSGGSRWARTRLPSRGGMGMALKMARITLTLTLTPNIITRGLTIKPREPGKVDAINRNTMAETAAKAKLVNMPARDIQMISLFGFLRL
jgi:hypothetical protein